MEHVHHIPQPHPVDDVPHAAGQDQESRRHPQGVPDDPAELYKAILQLQDEQECYEFFQDLCTVSELRAMEQRFEVASLLDDGMIYNDILERTGASSATISRVNRCLHYGAEGYHTVIPRLKGEKEEES